MKGASRKIGTVLDDLVVQVVNGFHGAIEAKVEGLANDVKRAIGAPTSTGSRSYDVGLNTGASASSSFESGVSGDGMSAGVPRAD